MSTTPTPANERPILTDPAYGLQSRGNPNHLLIIPQFLVENGGYELEG